MYLRNRPPKNILFPSNDECRVYQNATAPVKGEKVSLKIHRADLVDRKTVFQIGSFFMT